MLFSDPIAVYNPIPYTEFAKTLPQFDFAAYLSSFAVRTFPSRVIVDSPTFFPNLSAIIDSTPRSTILSYLETRAALTLAQNLGTETEAWKAVRSLEERLRGIKPGAVGDRAEFCVGKVEEHLGFAAGRFFVKEAFGGESKKKGTKVITGVYCLLVISPLVDVY